MSFGLRCVGGATSLILPFPNFPSSFLDSIHTTPPRRPHSLPTCKTHAMRAPSLRQDSDVGIICYLSNLPGFHAVLKHRYSDFIVNEVGLDGNVVHLTTFDVPSLNVVERADDKSNFEQGDFSCHIDAFSLLAGASDANLLKEYLQQIRANLGNEISPIILSPDANKLHRTEVHNFIKEKFNFLVTDTVDGPDTTSKCVRIRYFLRQQGRAQSSKKRKERENGLSLNDAKGFDSRGSDDWPQGVGKFLRFYLCKENKDTQEALGVIGKMLGIQQRSFGFAGTKDKRSVSTQRVTVFKQHAKRLAALNDKLIGIKVGNFCYVSEELVLGQLLGNRFTIILRGVLSDSEEIVKSAASGLGENGFINYFGLQRFGNGPIATHVVGAALLRGEWKTAVDLILDPREGERPDIFKARNYYKETGDVDGTLRQLRRHLVAERSVLQCLKKCPGNYLQALKSIPRTLRMMYVHSYQSYLWNHAASCRVQQYEIGKVVLGDLVCCKQNTSEKPVVDVKNDPEDTSSDEHDCSILEADVSEATLPAEKIDFVKMVEADDLLKGEYTLEDVVLPLPGSRVIYPGNDVANVYHDVAKKDAISLTESSHNVKEFSITSMTGGYRRIFQRPVDFEWELLNYMDANKPLVATDLDFMSKSKLISDKPLVEADLDIMSKSKLISVNDTDDAVDLSRKQNLSRLGAETNGSGSDDLEERMVQVEPFVTSDVQPHQLALKLNFTLPTSCYATIAVRELLKSSI